MALKIEKKCLKLHETKSWLFAKVNKINKLLVRLTKKQREKLQITKIRNKRADIATDSADIKRIIKDYHKQLYTYIRDNSQEMDPFLRKHKLPQLTQYETDNLIALQLLRELNL